MEVTEKRSDHPITLNWVAGNQLCSAEFCTNYIAVKVSSVGPTAYEIYLCKRCAKERYPEAYPMLKGDI